MNAEIFKVLQNNVEINVRVGIANHDKGHKEQGFKFEYDLWIMLEGGIDMEYSGVEYSLKKNDIFLIYPNTAYRAKVTEKVRFIYCHFSFNISNSDFSLNQFPVEGYLSAENINDRFKNAVSEFYATLLNINKENYMAEFINKQYFNIVIAMFLEHKFTNITTKDSDNGYAYSKISKVSPALDYIHQNASKTVSVKYMAELCGMSEKYFIATFKQILGVTPLKYYNHIRMHKAAELITEQKYSIKEIADMLSFKDQYNFSTAFKKHFDISPSKYLVNGDNFYNLGIE